VAPRATPSQLHALDERHPPLQGGGGPIEARRRGDLIHRLLQHLPLVRPRDRLAAAGRFLAGVARDLAAPEREGLVAEVMRVIEHDELVDLFGRHSRAELDVLARSSTAGAQEILGRIDRLAVTQDAILFADFKTGEPPQNDDEIPDAFVRQLALYRRALTRVYPGKAMRALLVWTAGPAIHRIEAERLDAALGATGINVGAP
jgi:ATP-dependent helicase/nuclease subunit A